MSDPAEFLRQQHPLLRRQWQRWFGRDRPPLENWQPFLRAVSEAYAEFDTARKLVERALDLSSSELHAANAELRGVVRVLPDLLFRVAADNTLGGVMHGSVIENHPALRALGAAAGSTAEAFRRATEQVRQSRAMAAFEFTGKPDAGGTWYEVRLLPFVGDDIIGIVRDITERKQAEHDRLVLGKLESTGILAGGIAHDFNNLLTTMLLNVDMASSPDTTTAEKPHYLATIRQGVFAAQVLTQQLITFARGGTALRQPIVLGPLLQDAVPLALSGSNVRSTVEVAHDLWATEVDAGQIGQVMRNLVLNAREAMPRGGIIQVRARNSVLTGGNVHGLPAGNYVQIAITDTGHGIAPEALPKIFDPYFSTKLRGTQKGMGLGLTICHSVAQKHGGAIAVESRLGQGSTFTVYLPASAPTPSPAAPAPAGGKPAALPRRVLVMDDEAMMRTVFKSVLEQLGHEPVLAVDGRAAVDLYTRALHEGSPFDVVILDLTVKGEMGGDDAARILRQVDPNVRAVVMSGYTDSDTMRNFLHHGFKARLVKPFDREALRRVLDAVLDPTTAEGGSRAAE